MQEVRKQTSDDESRVFLAEWVIDALGFPAAVVDGGRKVLLRNPPFAALMATWSGERLWRRVEIAPMPASGLSFLVDAGEGADGPRIIGVRLLTARGPKTYLVTVSSDLLGGAGGSERRSLQGDLTVAEQAVLFGMLCGQSLSDIADRRGIKVSTVRWHLKNIQSKLGMSDKAEVIAWLARSPVCWLAERPDLGSGA